MINEKLAKQIDEVREAITEASKEFNAASGLYVDVFIYKLKYLEALHAALMNDFKQSMEQDIKERKCAV